MELFGFFALLIPVWLICLSFKKLSRKNRGLGYYILAILFPLIGFIFACCLKKLDPKKENPAEPSLDITEDMK